MMIGLLIDFFTLLNVDSWLEADACWPDGKAGFLDGELVSRSSWHSGIVSIASFNFSFMFSTEQFDAVLQLLSLSFAMQSCESWLSWSADASSLSDD